MVSSRHRVLRVVTRLNIGGPARQALLLTRDLGDAFPTTLAAGHPTASEGELSDPAVPVRYVPLVRPVRPQVDARAWWALRRLLAETGATLLHTHMAKAGTLGRTAAFATSPRPRTVHTFHGHVLEGYFSPAVARGFVAVERALARRTDALVAVSADVRDALLDLDIGRPGQFHVIPLGIDLSAYLAVGGPDGAFRRRLGIGPATPLIGTVGRLVPIKDISTLLRVMTRLPEAHLAVVGDGELRPQLEGEASDIGVADRVHFVGWVTDMTEMAGVLADVDAVALTSRNEGTPVSLIEAAAAARPAVATDVGGVSRVVADGVSGYLAPPGDVDRIAGLLQSLLADPAARRRMGDAGRRLAANRFGQERLLADIRDLYTGL
ncbi:MAG: hypothetical protein QOD63_1715 [Actinomycetota bacterium]|jgi:glycosyltransferase involved in cell wall biosynthesis|nr:hypothetical protein [Actinomycetota bacterium]